MIACLGRLEQPDFPPTCIPSTKVVSSRFYGGPCCPRAVAGASACQPCEYRQSHQNSLWGGGVRRHPRRHHLYRSRLDLHLNTVQMGWVFNAFCVAYALFEIPGGFLGDWIGPRKVLMRVVLWWSVF